MKNFKYLVKSALIILVGWCSFNVGVNKISASGAGYGVRIVYPNQQSKNNKGGIYVRVRPGATIKYGVIITNSSKKAKTLYVKPKIAGTTGTFQIDYSDRKRKTDSSVKYNYEKWNTKTQKITVPANSKKQVDEVLQIPNNPKIKGAVMGSLIIYEKQKNHKPKKNQKVSIYNNFQYSMGIVADIGDTWKVNPDFKITKAFPRSSGGSGAVQVNVQNFKPQYLVGQTAKIRTGIYQRGSKKELKHYKTTQGSFAANSTAGNIVSWDNEVMNPGQYTAKTTIKGGGKTWHLSKNFTITPEQANKINKNNGKLKKDYRLLWIIIIILVILIIGGIIYYVYQKAIKKGQNMSQN